MADYPHTIAPPWPDGGGGPYCRHCHKGEADIDPEAECEVHKKDALAGLVTRIETENGPAYRMGHGIEEINKLANEGWEVVAAGWPGAGCIALMRRK